MKILNLYSGIGGNRKLWGDEHEVTTVEYDPEIARVYSELYPNDTVIVTDAHQYLIDHVQDGWDFIWSSPPCPSHSRIMVSGNHPARYPEMSLYQEIIMLSNNWYKGHWCVENVIPYYTPLIPPSKEIERHLFWSNFTIKPLYVEKEIRISKQTSILPRHGIMMKGVEFKGDKRKVLRNLVNPEIGLHILNCAFDISCNKSEQTSLFG